MITSLDGIHLNYYGEVFSASGYGQAARAYIHAFNEVGIKVSVVDTGPVCEVRDELIASLLRNDSHAHFNLFHGIPSFWARSAYALKNVIAMTVWEADRIPQRWRNPLSHAIDVWVPTSYNVESFSRDLQKKPFCLPHAILPSQIVASQRLPYCNEIKPSDFVFYSVFEWQDRKNPRGLLYAFLREFSDESDALLFIKSGSSAGGVAKSTLDEIRTETGSSGRVILCCDDLDESQMRDLYARGDCYVSLHRGEGWGYPLFVAACNGTPVISTAYGGPLEYLNPKNHWLVRSAISRIREPYFLYRSAMKWAEPDLEHARDGFRWIYSHPGAMREAAQSAANELIRTYSTTRVGSVAKARLLDLRKRMHEAQPLILLGRSPVRTAPPTPTTPIPADWYDADYFESGLKSNWSDGYEWRSFRGLFAEVASFLRQTFPDARSYIDAGCAKGFLVQALRERGLDAIGFDHSAWAIDHANRGIRQFLKLGDVELVDYEDKSADILVIMSLLESLTESQILKFLSRGRHWVREALFATIPVQDSAFDYDLSHITARDNKWWRGRFVETGWRPHRVEHIIGRHELPKRMKWRTYAFSPNT